METKVCRLCGVSKSLDSFSKRGSGTKVRNTCRECCKQLKAEKRHPDIKERNNSLVNSLLELSRYDYSRLNLLSEDDFRSKVDYERFDYEWIKTKAIHELKEKGYLSNKTKYLTEDGIYLVLGESRGKFTKRAFFSFLNNFIECFDVKNIIHLGYALDDDGDLSYIWNDYSNLIFVAKNEELPIIYKNAPKATIVTESVFIGNIECVNQHTISAYTTQSINTLDSYYYKNPTIVNSTRLEYFQKNDKNHARFIASTGTTAIPHVTKKLKIGCSFNNLHASKYDRMKFAINYWNNGIVVVEIKNGVSYCYPLSVKYDDVDGYSTCYGEKFVSSKTVEDIRVCDVVLGDIHAPRLRKDAYAILLDVLAYHKNTIRNVVLVGDVSDCRSLNPHVTDRPAVTDGDFLTEIAWVKRIVSDLSDLSSKVFMLLGNHEKWGVTFSERNAGIHSLINTLYQSVGCTVSYKPFGLGSNWFMHGDEQIFGASGSVLNKISATYPDTLNFIGHFHRPAISKNCVNVPCLCDYDQGYNDETNSNWKNGFTFVYNHHGKSYPVNLLIDSSGDRDTLSYCMREYYNTHPEIDFTPARKIVINL